MIVLIFLTGDNEVTVTVVIYKDMSHVLPNTSPTHTGYCILFKLHIVYIYIFMQRWDVLFSETVFAFDQTKHSANIEI